MLHLTFAIDPWRGSFEIKWPSAPSAVQAASDRRRWPGRRTLEVRSDRGWCVIEGLRVPLANHLAFQRAVERGIDRGLTPDDRRGLPPVDAEYEAGRVHLFFERFPLVRNALPHERVGAVEFRIHERELAEAATLPWERALPPLVRDPNEPTEQLVEIAGFTLVDPRIEGPGSVTFDVALEDVK